MKTQFRNEIDKLSYSRLIERKQTLEHQLEDIRSQIGDLAYEQNSAEDSTYRSMIEEEKRLVAEINSAGAEINNSIVIEKAVKTNTIELGDHVRAIITYANGDVMDKIFTLVGSEPNSSLGEISKHSAIGKFLYKRTVGATGEVLLPNGSIATVKIISKE